MPANQVFEIFYKDTNARIEEHHLPSGRIFRITFGELKIKPLVITVAEDKQGTKYWVSIPDGRGEEAKAIGKLIATYIRSKR
jgi:hypothetical protein